jgi:hypothetical protein
MRLVVENFILNLKIHINIGDMKLVVVVVVVVAFEERLQP